LTKVFYRWGRDWEERHNAPPSRHHARCSNCSFKNIDKCVHFGDFNVNCYYVKDFSVPTSREFETCDDDGDPDDIGGALSFESDSEEDCADRESFIVSENGCEKMASQMGEEDTIECNEIVSELHKFPLETPLIGGMPGRNQFRRKKNRPRRRRERRNKPAPMALDPFRPMLSRAIPGRTGVPNTLMVNLVSTGQITIKSSTAPYAFGELRLNSAYGPDSSNSAVQGTGFNMYSEGYAFNTVYDAWIDFTVNNLDTAQPCNIGMVFSDVQPSTVIVSFGGAEAALQRPPCIPKQAIGVLTGMSTLNKNRLYRVTPYRILGNRISYLANANYSGSAGAGPTAVIWGSWILLSDLSSGTLPTGVVVNYTLTQRVKFYSNLTIVALERKNILAEIAVDEEIGSLERKHIPENQGRIDQLKRLLDYMQLHKDEDMTELWSGI